MTRISTPLFHQLSVNALLDQQKKLSDTQLRISSGKKFLSPADDPIGASRLLNLKQQESETNQFQRSIGTALFDLSSEEVQMKNMQVALIKARELLVSVGNGSYDSNNLKTVKDNIQNVLDQVVDIANTNLDGEYMFSGSKSVTKPVVKDANGVYQYTGDELQREAKIGPSIRVPVNDTAKTIFFQLPTSDVSITTGTGQTSVTTTNPGLTTSAALQKLDTGELYVNGIIISPATDDLVSTTDKSASAIATAAVINSTTSKHGVVATVNATAFDFTGGTYGSGTLATGDLTINGINIVGDINAQTGATNLDKLVTLVNTSSATTGMIASNVSSELRLNASDGRNVQLVSDGTTSSGVNFGNFAINGGSALDMVYRSTVTLNDHQAITIATNTTTGTANDVGFSPNTYSVGANSGTATLSTPYFIEAPPAGTSLTENYRIEFVTASTYHIYRESDPTTPITNFKTFSASQNFNNATVVSSVPASYTTGDSIVVDGILLSISGTPVANDSFTIDTEKDANQNMFKVMQNLITAISSYQSEPTRLNYHVGLALTNLENAENRVSEVRSEIGARLSLAETQEDSNEEFLFFAKQGISEIEDLDVISAISTLVQQQLAFEAAQRSIVKIQNLSLFDFL